MSSPESNVESPSADDESGGILQRGGITIVGAVAGGALILANEVIAARLLGVGVYGLYALAFAFAKMGEAISLSGLQVGVLRFLPIDLSDGRLDRARGTILASVMLPAVVGACSVGLIWLLSPWFASTVFGEPEALWYIRLFSFAIPFMCLSEILATVTRGFGYAAPYVVVRHLVPPATYLILLIVIFATGANPLWVAVAFCASYVAALAAGVVSVAKVTDAAVWRSKPVFRLRALYAYSFPIVLNTLLYVVIGYTDVVMLGSLSGPPAAGVYRGCLQLIAVFPMIIIALSASAAHIYPILALEKRTEELDRAYSTVTRFMMVLAIVAATFIGLNRVDLLAILGPEFTVGASALGVLLACQLVRSCVGSGAFLLVVAGHQKFEAFAVLVGAFSNLLLNLLLIPRYGLVGAATATAIAHLVMSVMRVVWIRRSFGFLPLRMQLLRATLAGLAVALVVVVVARSLGVQDGTGLAQMAMRAPLIIALLAICLWRFGLEDEDRDLLRSTLAPRFSRGAPPMDGSSGGR